MKNGGPAFPTRSNLFAHDGVWRNLSEYGEPNEPGMSLLDWFAGMAMQGLLAAGGDFDREGLAHDAYKFARGMIELHDARSEKGGSLG